MLKKRLSFGFVILHYKTDAQTCRCIDSIINNINDDNYIIIVVDNFSNNGSIEKVEKKYRKNKKIHILKNNKNLGFARGNNVGINWLNDNYKVEFIVVLNNDTQIISNDFISNVRKEFAKSNFAVMGPKILLKNKKINPLCRQDITLERAYKENKFIIRQLVICRLRMERLKGIVKKIINKPAKIDKEVMDVNKYYSNVVLHGCFLVFSKEFFSKYKGFDERTFLYHEEELLFLRLKKSNLKSIYNPSITIFHEEDAATDFYIPNERRRAIFKLKNVYKSNKVLISELKKMEEI